MKPGYKRTNLGVIPEEWDALPARDIGTLKGGNGFPLTAQGEAYGAYPFYKVSDMNNEGNDTFMTTANHYISEPTRKRLSALAFPTDTIVFAKVGAAIFLERKKILGQPSCIDNNMAGFVLDKTKADVRYVHSLLLSKKLGDLVATTALPALNGKQLGALSLAIPPLLEQRAIAQALSDVDALIATLDRLIAKKRDIKQATMQQLLTGKTRLPGFSGKWNVKALGELGTISGGGVDKKIKPGEVKVRLVNYMDVYRRNLIRSVELEHVVSAPPDQASRCAVRKGDVFFTPSSEMPYDIAASAVAAEDIPDACYSYHVARLRLHEEWDIPFRAYAFKTQAFLDQAAKTCEGSGVRYVITQGKFRQLTLKYPADRSEQAAIATVLSDMDAGLTALEARRDKTRALKQGMMQELLTGKTRLI